jgi:adenylyltransferase/sulfurtransferase
LHYISKEVKMQNRYSRQALLEQIGASGQERLGETKVLVVGCGALGSVISDHLARAGMGMLRIIDRDIVEIENLQRQILYTEEDVGRPKAQAAKERLRVINSEINVEGLVRDFTPKSAEEVLDGVDIVLDGTDNMQTRYLINDICIKNGIPWIYGGAVSTYGMTLNIVPQKTACLSCAFPYIPKAGSLPTCDTVGVINTVPSIIASIEATEAIKIILEKEYSKDLIIYDVWSHDFKRIKIGRSKECECCQNENFKFLAAEKQEVTTVLCGRDSVQVTPNVEGKVSLDHLAQRLRNAGEVKQSPVHIIFRTQDIDITIFSDGRAIVKGTEDETQAKSIYAKYIGN